MAKNRFDDYDADDYQHKSKERQKAIQVQRNAKVARKSNSIVGRTCNDASSSNEEDDYETDDYFG